MPDVMMVLQLALPLAMFVGGIAAWRATRRQQVADDRPDKPTWRDDSLDDWRREREAEIEAERLARVAQASTHGGDTSSQSEANQDSQKQTRQTLGG